MKGQQECLLSTQTDGVSDTSETPPINSDQQISSDQALATASQVMIRDDSQSTSQPVVNQSSSQDPILAELLKMSQRFGHLEEQAAKDRQVLMGLVSEFGKQGQPVQRLINQTQATSQVSPVEQNHNSNSANHSVQDLLYSAGADRDTINVRTNSEGNVIHNKQIYNTSNHTSSVGSLFSTPMQGVNLGVTNHSGTSSQSVTQQDPSVQCSANYISQQKTWLFPHTRLAGNKVYTTTPTQQARQSGFIWCSK